MEKNGTKLGAVGILAFMVLSTVGAGFVMRVGGDADLTPKTGDVFGSLIKRGEVPVWSDEVCLTTGDINHTNPTITIDKEGNLHLAWIAPGESDPMEISYIKSMDCGVHWTEPKAVYKGMPEFVKLRYNHYRSSLDMLIVDPVYIRRGEPTILYQISYNEGENWTGPYPIPVSWDALTLSLANEYKIDFTSEIYSYFSIHDDTRKDEVIFTINDLGKIVSEKGFDGTHRPAIASWKNDVYTVIPTEDGLNFSRSEDNGSTWSSPVKISSRGGATSKLIVNGENLYFVWANNSSGNYELYFKESSDKGNTWSNDIRLTYASGDSIRPSVSMNSDGTLNIVWEDSRDGNWKIHYKKIDNHGNTIVNDMKLSNSSGKARCPEIATDSYDDTYVVWQDNRNGKWDIFFKKFPSTDIVPPLIEHDPINIARKNESISINATVRDNFGVDSVLLHFGDRIDNITHSLKMSLTSGTIKNGTWKTSFVPSALGNRSVFYYIEANDTENTCRTPVYSIRIKGCLPRFAPPTNTTTSLEKEIEIDIHIEADFGVDSTVLFYKTNQSQYSNVTMKLVSGTEFSGIWEANIPPQTKPTTITYYIEAWSGEEKNTTKEYSLKIKADISGSNNETGENLEVDNNAYIYPLILVILILIVSLSAILWTKNSRKSKRKEEKK